MGCASATQAWDWSLSHGDDENALRYLRIAMSLLPPDDAAQQAVYVERLADLLAHLAQQDFDAGEQLVSASTQPATADGMHERARSRWIERAKRMSVSRRC